MPVTLEQLQKLRAEKEQARNENNLGYIKQVREKNATQYTQEDIQKDNAIHLAFNESLTGDAEQEASEIRLSEMTGAETGFVHRNYDKIRETWTQAGFNARDWRRKNPDIAAKILERPDLGKAFMRDQNLNLVAQALNKVADSYKWIDEHLRLDKSPFLSEEQQAEMNKEFGKQDLPIKSQAAAADDLLRTSSPGKMLVREDAQAKEVRKKWYGPMQVPFYRYSETGLQQEISTDNFELMGRELIGMNSTDLQKRILDKKQLSVPRDYQEGAVGQVFTDVAQGAANTTKIIKDAGLVGGVAAVATYGAARGISYITKIPIPAGKLAIKVGSKFFKGVQFLGSFRLETGAAYDDLRNNTLTEDGKKLSKYEAAGGAIIYGSMAAGLELAGETILLRSLGPLGEAITKGEGKAAMNALMKDASFREIAKVVGKKWAEAGGAEGGTGALQEAWQEAVTYFTKSVSQGKFQSKTEISGQKIVDAGVKEATGGFGLATIGAHVNLATQMAMHGRSVESGKVIAQISKLTNSTAVRAAPEAVADIITSATMRTGQPVTHMYVDPGGLIKALEGDQDQIHEAMTTLMGEEGPQKLQDAITSGTKIEIPLADYLEKWGSKPIAAKLAEHTTTAEDLMTPSEMKEFDKETAALEEEQTAKAREIKDHYDKMEEAASKEASDKEVVENTAAEATSQPSRQQLFRSPEEAGMNADQWKKYLDDHAKSTSKAARYAELRKRREELKTKTAEWKADKEKFVADATKEYSEHPAVKAKELLTSGNPDDVASLTGFSTGKELIEAVKGVSDSKKWIADRANQKMNEKHPDMASQKTALKQFINEGFHGEYTLSWLRQEMAALKQKVDPEAWQGWHQAMLDAPISAVKRAVVMKVDSLHLKDLSPSKILQRENSAAEKALRAVMAGNYLQAAVYRQQQIYHHLLWKELVKAKQEKDAFLKLVGQMKKGSSFEKINKTSTILGDGIYKLLNALEFIPKMKISRERATLEQVSQLVEQLGGTSFDPETLQTLVADAADRPGEPIYKKIKGLPSPRFQIEPLWKRMSVNEMRHTVQALKNIRATAYSASTALAGMNRIDQDIAAHYLRAEAAKNVKPKGPITSTPESEDTVEQSTGIFTGIDGSLTKPEALAMRMGGENVKSWWYQLIVKPLQIAKRAESELRKLALQPIMDMFDKIPDEVQKTWRDSVNGKELFKTHTGKMMAPRMRFELIMLVLNSGNYSNLGRLIVGRGISVEEIQHVIDNVLTTAEMDWIQAVWDAADRKFTFNGVETSLWGLASNLEERDSGLAPQKIEGRELQKNGKKYKGGYFPAVYDLRVAQPVDKSSPGQILMGQTIQGLLDPYYNRPGTPHGFMKRRAQNFNGIITLSPSVIRAHFSQLVHDITHREAVKSVGGLLLRKDVDGAMKQALGPQVSKQMVQWVRDVGTQRGQDAYVHTEDLNRWVRTRKKALSSALLGWRATLALTEIPKIFLARRYVDNTHWSAGLAEFARDRKATVAFVFGKSKEMPSRMDQTAQEFEHQMRKLTNTGALSRGALGWYRDHAFTFMEWAFKSIATPVWLGAYRQAMMEHGNEELAIDFAESVISKIFVSYATVDQAAILRDKGFWGISTMFYGEMNTGYNLLRETAQPLLNAKSAEEFAKAMPKVTGEAMALFMFYNILPNLILGRGPPAGGDDNKALKWAKWFGVQLAISPLQFLPEVGNLAESVANTALRSHELNMKTVVKSLSNPDFNIRSGPVATLGAATLQALASAGKVFTGSSKDPQEDLMSMAKGMGLWLGQPVFPVVGTVDYALGLARGKERPRGGLDVASGLGYGPPRKNEKLNPLTALSELINGNRKQPQLKPTKATKTKKKSNRRPRI